MTKEEVEYALAAEEERWRDGYTAKRCPWCGGELIFKYWSSASVIYCENKDGFNVTMRGI